VMVATFGVGRMIGAVINKIRRLRIESSILKEANADLRFENDVLHYQNAKLAQKYQQEIENNLAFDPSEYTDDVIGDDTVFVHHSDASGHENQLLFNEHGNTISWPSIDRAEALDAGWMADRYDLAVQQVQAEENKEMALALRNKLIARGYKARVLQPKSVQLQQNAEIFEETTRRLASQQQTKKRALWSIPLIGATGIIIGIGLGVGMSKQPC
ncbi:RHS repeat-associated core domain-containing protein, partial [Fangia hongkongensis]|nr:RHS repeat-associated core domain-containing protein [Fangia hongkongensis]